MGEGAREKKRAPEHVPSFPLSVCMCGSKTPRAPPSSVHPGGATPPSLPPSFRSRAGRRCDEIESGYTRSRLKLPLFPSVFFFWRWCTRGEGGRGGPTYVKQPRPWLGRDRPRDRPSEMPHHAARADGGRENEMGFPPHAPLSEGCRVGGRYLGEWVFTERWIISNTIDGRSSEA